MCVRRDDLRFPSPLPVSSLACELVLSLNDASPNPPRPAPPARPLDDPPLDFRPAAPAADIGVGSNAGGDVDAPVNESPLHTSGMELNDSSSESADFRLVDRPLDRRRGAAPPSDASEFLLDDCPRVDLDVEALPCARTERARRASAC